MTTPKESVVTNNEELLKLAALADRVEAARRPDRDLDAAIWWRAYGSLRATEVHIRVGMEKSPHRQLTKISPGWKNMDEVPAYTASLDAAMLLAESVGEAWGRPHNLCIATAYGSAYIVPNDGGSYGINDPLKGQARAIGKDEIGRTARAITAACLRARAAA
jgi:hypothetical protein